MRDGAREGVTTASGFEVTTHGGRQGTGHRRRRVGRSRERGSGAGEILLNSMDADGTESGYDLPLIELVRREVSVPLIASGGAGRIGDFVPAVQAGADAVLAASVFHFGTLAIAEVKAELGRRPGTPSGARRRGCGPTRRRRPRPRRPSRRRAPRGGCTSA